LELAGFNKKKKKNLNTPDIPQINPNFIVLAFLICFWDA